MTTMAVQMCTFSSQARALTTSVRNDTHKRELADLGVRIAAWKKKEKEKAKNAIAQLPAVIKDLAENGKSRLVVQVEVSPPHLVSEIFNIYKVLNRWDFQYLLESETPDSGDRLSLYKIRNLRDGARLIARWALKEGFTVLFLKWDDRLRYERVENCDFIQIDQLVTPVLAGSCYGGWSVEEGFMITW